MLRPLRRLAVALPLALAGLTAAPDGEAFCGFYVAGGDAKLFNNATVVVLLRDGTRTVLSMQNNYQGPPEDFAMVVPVPVVLQKENVKTLPRELFEHVDRFAAPRLVEYWEQDPCPPPRLPKLGIRFKEEAMAPSPASALGVRIEAEFVVGEYDVVILSAEDALGLDTWLRQQQYNIPDGAEPLLRPYVQGGMKFFVAKVIASKVKFENGQAMLSPLRFHYDAESFSLPIRLGLVNSGGTQDLLVHILAKDRYEVANYPNVTIPTNIDVAEDVRERFGAFYAALFDETLEKHPGAVVTEYAWGVGSCDPCPGPALSPQELMLLGADQRAVPEAALKNRWWGPGPIPPNVEANLKTSDLVITRLHARYTKASLGEDLVFRAAPPIVGGREVRQKGRDGPLERGASPSSFNNFQGRYAIRHPWRGPITCLSPERNRWGGPPGGHAGDSTRAAEKIAFAPRDGTDLPALLRSDIPELGLVAAGVPVSAAPIGIGPFVRIAIYLGIVGVFALVVRTILKRRRARRAKPAGHG